MASPEDTPLLVERDGSVLRLTLNSLQRANVLDLASDAARTEDARERMAAFLQKRASR